MGMFLNSSVPYEGYKEVLRDTYFVDKTLLLKELIPYFGKRNRYCCITRPRRFGKTVMADMVGRFSGKRVKRMGYLRSWQYPGTKIIKYICIIMK